MRVLRNRQIQGLQQQHLPRRVREVIITSQHERNAHQCIVDGVREKERRAAVGATNDEIADVVGFEALLAVHEIGEANDLAGRHELLLLTKGEREEQQRKLDACGLLHHIRAAHIVPEKDADTYRWLAREHAFDPAAAWMIGNSPRSDILPARAAGMNAVFIPNENTWVLEHDELDPSDQRVIRLAAFPDLVQHF